MHKNISPRVVAPASRPSLRQSFIAQAARQALLTLALAGTAAWLPAAAQAQPAGTVHSVPAGPLGEALARFASAAGVSLQLDAALVAGRSSAGLQGRFGVRQGFEQLLAGAGLAAHEQRPGVWVVRAAPRELGELPVIRVTAAAERAEAGSRTVLTAEDVERHGGTGIADVIRYQPLVEAPGTTLGSTRGASRYDRGGTTNYNIRGVEGNRVGLDVDGIEMPDAISRAPLTARSEDGSFGMGRDFIDPDLYASVDIQSGTTTAQRSAGGIGGAVSFRSKSPEDFVSAAKPFHAGAKLGYSEANGTWSKGATLAAQQGDVGLLLAYTRRDGRQTDNHSDTVPAYPEDWHSDALLLKGVLRVNPAHRLELAADLYRKRSDSSFDAWDTNATAITGSSVQAAATRRNTVSLAHTWTPEPGGLVDRLDTRLYVQSTDMDDVTDTVTRATNAQVREASRNTTRQVGFSSLAEKRIANHGLKFGFNHSRSENEHPFTSTEAFGAGQPFPDTLTLRTGAFAEDSIDVQLAGRRLTVVPGLRVDRVDPAIRNTGRFGSPRITQAELEAMYGNAPATTIASPSLAVLLEVQPGLTAYAQWKRSGRAPTNSEIFGYWNSGGGSYALLGDRHLKAETSNAFDIGLKGTPARGVTLAASVFQTRYSDFISYTRYTRANNPEKFVNIQPSLSILYQASNRDEARIHGAELSLRLEHGVWAPVVQGLYSTWALGYSQGSAKSNYAGDKDVDLDTVQPAKAVAGVGFDAAQRAWGLHLAGTFVRGKQAAATTRQSFSNNPGAQLPDATTVLYRVPGFARFDLAGHWRLAPHLRLQAAVLNLADKRYWSYASARSLQPANARDRQQIELSSAPGRTFTVGLSAEY